MLAKNSAVGTAVEVMLLQQLLLLLITCNLFADAVNEALMLILYVCTTYKCCFLCFLVLVCHTFLTDSLICNSVVCGMIILLKLRCAANAVV